MTCAKQPVFCKLVFADGDYVVGTNGCTNPQLKCPREPGEDYTKCKTICGQGGHAEISALQLAGDRAKGAGAYLAGHTYACKECQEALFGAGVAFLSIVSFEKLNKA
jgi:deoxycytidylate deaminase